MLMCNKRIGRLSETPFQSENKVVHQQPCWASLEMDSTLAAFASAPGSARSSSDENPRVKLLCSFSGSIMPRPQDGKLRYVGGETRIVSLPRDINYEELMVRMRELYEGATLLKYQQPDEDLDALVSVVNDDDVTNMMDEYDKLGSGDGFTRLRVFLFSHPEQASSPHFVDADEMDPERRYVDALNSLTESSLMNSAEEAQVADQFYNQGSLEGGIHNQMNFEMPITQFNLHQLTIPRIGSGQHQPAVTQRYNEMEAQWSPVYYSPGHHGQHDPRPLAEFPSSPSSARLRMPFGELPDKMPEEYNRQPVNQQSQYDHSPRLSENAGWFPSGAMAGDQGGFPGNILHGSNVFEGSNICEHCRMGFQRSHVYPDSHWHGEQSRVEQPIMGNGVPQVTNPCPECPPNREPYVLNMESNFHHGLYPKEQTDSRPLYNDPHNHERGWTLPHHLNPRADEVRIQMARGGRLMDHYIVDGHGPGVNFPLGHGNISDGRRVPSNCVHHEDPRYIRAGQELGKDVFHDQVVAAGAHIQSPPDERGLLYRNFPYAHGTDNIYQVSHGHAPGHDSWRNVSNQMHGAPYEASNSVQQANGTLSSGFIKGAVEGSPRFFPGAEGKSAWIESSPEVLGLSGSAVPDYSDGCALNLNSGCSNQVNQQYFGQDQVQPLPDFMKFVSPGCIPYSNPSTLTSEKLVSSSIPDHNLDCTVEGDVTEAVKREHKSILGEEKVLNSIETFEGGCVSNISSPRNDERTDKVSEVANQVPVNFNCLRCPEESGDVVKPGESNLSAVAEDTEISNIHLSFLPELLESVKRVTLEGAEKVAARVQEEVVADPLQVLSTKEAVLEESAMANANEESALDSENDAENNATIEPTKAEEEAIARGLQTIKNDDLEEIRELGSGTYGAVYHGKWKGSDVAVKRIKASCFAGRPSERERLIADFWKEALILSSLHHPNVVSFYGIVRDGPGGSLATVTEFMINGSLKQFLKKKDRTIDRRKRLIIAMDTAFGMEYLHGRNIVHFDLKCENLLVNMRDPHRPVCKIGDLGLSKVKQHTLVSGGVRGTLPWMAPELLSGKSNMVTEKIDVYSFGVVMWELLTGEEPYADTHCASIIGGIVNNTLRPQIPTWCDPEWRSLMESCWASDPSDRPSFTEISQKLRSMAAAMNVK